MLGHAADADEGPRGVRGGYAVELWLPQTRSLPRILHQNRLSSLLRGLHRIWPRAYAGIWLSTLGVGLLVALLGKESGASVRSLLGLRPTSGRNAPPELGPILALAAHNLPIAAWPVLLGVVGAHHHRVGRRAADVVLFARILGNTVPVRAALVHTASTSWSTSRSCRSSGAGSRSARARGLLQRRRPLGSPKE